MNNIFLKLFMRFIDLIDQNNKKKIINFFKKKLSSNLITVIDIGAHKGETIDLFIKNLNTEKIYSFEPNPELFKYLTKKYFNLNKIKLFNLGVGKSSENKELNIFKDSSSSTLNTINENSDYFKRKKKFLSLFLLGNKFLKKKQIVKIINLSQFISDENIKKIDILKIDTEGYEFHIIDGIDNLDFDMVKFIYFEHHYDLMLNKGYKFSDINKILKKNNFEKKYKIRMRYRKSFEYIYEKKN